MDYILKVGVNGAPPVYVDGTKQTYPPKPATFTIGVGAQIPGFDETVSDMALGEKRLHLGGALARAEKRLEECPPRAVLAAEELAHAPPARLHLAHRAEFRKVA